jgi:hypothetical protein
MNSVPPPVSDAKIKYGPSEFEHAQARRLLAALDAAQASGVRSRIRAAYKAIALKVERIRPRLAAIVAAGGGPVDANGQPLYVVCPRCGRLLRQYVHDRHGARISTGCPEDCVKCIERGIFP